MNKKTNDTSAREKNKLAETHTFTLSMLREHPNLQDQSTRSNMGLIETGIVIKHQHSCYKILEQIGCGAFSEVQKVLELNSNVIQALKVQQENVNQLTNVDSSFVNHSNEIEIQSLIEQQFLNKSKSKQQPLTPSSKNFIDFKEHFETSINGHKFQLIVMDFLDIDLKNNYIAKNVIIDLPSLLTMTQKLSICLQILSKCNIIHLDLKSENILIKKRQTETRKSYEFFLSDFGHSITTDRSKNIVSACSLNQRPPELLFAQPFDCTADIQSLGVILLEMLLGNNPFKASSVGECIYQHSIIFGRFSREWVFRSDRLNQTKYFSPEGDLLESKRVKWEQRHRLDPKWNLKWMFSLIQLRQSHEPINFEKLFMLVTGMTQREPRDRLKHVEIEKLLVSILNEQRDNIGKKK